MTVFPHVTPGIEAPVRPHAPVNGAYPAAVTVVDRVVDSAGGSFGARLTPPDGDSVLPGGHRYTPIFLPE